MHILVTVGSTKFDALVDIVTSVTFFTTLIHLGYTHLSLQTGTSQHMAPLKYKTLSIKSFQYTDDLQTHIQKSHTVISHAGSGTVLEVLKANKRLLVCVNESLMDDHQSELAGKLECLNAAQTCSIQSLIRVLNDMHTDKRDYQMIDLNNGSLFSEYLDNLVFQ